MGDFDKPVPRRNRRTDHSFDAEQVETDRGADDVGDGIYGTDFVKVYFLDGAPMDLRFGVGQPLEDSLRKFALTA